MSAQTKLQRDQKFYGEKNKTESVSDDEAVGTVGVRRANEVTKIMLQSSYAWSAC